MICSLGYGFMGINWERKEGGFYLVLHHLRIILSKVVRLHEFTLSSSLGYQLFLSKVLVNFSSLKVTIIDFQVR